MNILCWNCRGLGDPAIVRELCNIARDCAPTVLCVVETQIAKDRMEGLAGSLGYDSAYGVASSGRSGGLCIYWKSTIQLGLRNYSKYHIDMKVEEQGKDPWRLTVWYGEANRSLRYKTWDMMRFLKADCDLPWLCIVDFNEVLRREEQFGPNERDMAQINLFREAVDVFQLQDIGYEGLDWTFERKINNNDYCRVRLDRALATADWCDLFPLARLRHLTAVKSDHSPILLMNHMDAANQRIALAKIFRYELVWERHDGFRPMVQASWGSAPCRNTADLCAKLRAMAGSCAAWDKESFENVRAEQRELRKRL